MGSAGSASSPLRHTGALADRLEVSRWRIDLPGRR